MLTETHHIWIVGIAIYLFIFTLYLLGFPWAHPEVPVEESDDVATFETLTDQERMERLVEHVQRIDQFQNTRREFLPVTLWPNVTCDESENVTDIMWNAIWSKVYLHDSIMDLWWLPPYLRAFDIGYSQVVGVFFAVRLPRTLRQFTINACNFKGTVDWSSLPPNLEILDVSNTSIEGCIDFTELPANLKQLRIQNTDLKSYLGEPSSNLTVVGINDLQRKMHSRAQPSADEP